VGPLLTEIDIKRFEKDAQLSLPVEYKDFLLKNNGGSPERKFFAIEDFANNPVGQVQLFFGINCEVASRNVVWNRETFLGRIPRDLLPIAREDGGNLICISIGGANNGAVFYWDHDAETFPADRNNIYLISRTFLDFINGMYCDE
jgi:hypothetical protein